MTKKPTLHVMVGLPGSGKTTKAKELEMEHNALRLTCDEWHIRLFGYNPTDENHGRNHENIEEIMLEIAEKVLSHGVSVIIDFGSWSRAERDDLRRMASKADANFKIHFMDVPIEKLYERLKKRNQLVTTEGFVISKEKMDRYLKLFEPPTEEEFI
ncbi:MAG: ATP-binding protein [Candidatus Nomurabacteria bacterium]|jgi:predicted kinase|nr:ATP-binding protein [Candidatus Nomurabacteria bacterium]